MQSDKYARYASRLNAFRAEADSPEGSNRVTTSDMLRAAARAGLDAADLNYPDHFENEDPTDLKAALDDNGMALNGLAMRYYADPAFKLGAFTHPDRDVRRAAIDLTRRGIDVGREMGTNLMTLWMGQDGFDTSFQADYAAMWDRTMEALDAVCAHDRDVDVAVEYKPNEPRAFALMPDIGTTLLALRELNAPNAGVTLDFAHVLYADEMPAHSAALVARHSRLLGVHLNDGYGKWDNGLMVAAVHPIQTVELLVALLRSDYDRTVYFDTFPDHTGLDAVEEARTNIETVERLWRVAERLKDNAALAQATAAQDAAAAQRVVGQALYRD